MPATDGPKLRGRLMQTSISLPPDVMAEIDAMAEEQERSRAKMIELLLRGAVRSSPMFVAELVQR
jgi:metal-responsive CopG/Arc/MetJ family transcriptional regulator